jgi:hypothetical protein
VYPADNRNEILTFRVKGENRGLLVKKVDADQSITTTRLGKNDFDLDPNLGSFKYSLFSGFQG